MTTLTEMPKYEVYKDSGAEWLGIIPDEWDVLSVKHMYRLIVNPAPKNNNYELLSVYSDIGVKPRAELEERGNKASTTDGYFMVKKGDLVVNKLLAWMGALGISDYDGVTSPAYDVLRPQININNKFFHYLFRMPSCMSELKKHSRGIMDMRLRLYFDKFGYVKVPYPEIGIQNKIVQFLDEKTAKIDEAIAIKEKQIELLKERKQIIIQQAVTQGLDPTVPMKDSGVEWIGKIPAHWEVLPLKRLATLSPTVKVENRKSKELVTFLAMEKVSTSGNIEQDTFLPICNVSQGFTIFNRGDVIIAKITPCFENGKSAWLNTLATDFGYGSTEFHVVRCSQRILGSFLYLIVSSPLFLTAGEAMMTGSAGQKRVPSSFIQNFPTAIPNIEEQARIVNEVHEEFNQIDFVIQSSNYQIEKLKEYKTTLINSAVTGKIKVV